MQRIMYIDTLYSNYICQKKVILLQIYLKTIQRSKWLLNTLRNGFEMQTKQMSLHKLSSFFLPAVETWFWHFILTWWLFNWKGSAYLCFEIQLHNFMLHYVAVVNSFPWGNFCNCFNPSFPPTWYKVSQAQVISDL